MIKNKLIMNEFDPKTKLAVQFALFENALAYQTRLIDRDVYNNILTTTFSASNGIKIASNLSSSLIDSEHKCLILKLNTNRVQLIYFDNNRERNAFLEKCNDALNEFKQANYDPSKSPDLSIPKGFNDLYFLRWESL